jgi:hypothetical protein
MKTKTFLGFVLATVIALFAISAVMATLPVTINQVEVNDVVLSDGVTLAGTASDSLPIVVQFTANAALEDLKVKVWIDGYRNDISASTSRFNVVENSTYSKSLTLTLPSVDDMDELNEDLTLYVEITDKSDNVEGSYQISLERESYAYDLLQADAPMKASAGEIIGVDVVLKNTGSSDLEDSFVTVSIPELGVSKKAYFGDLVSQDCIDTDDENCDTSDARERRIYVTIPSDVKTGDYSIEIKASNADASSIVRKVISITGTTSQNNTNTVTPVTNDKAGMPTSIVVLTVILVVVFVVLLVVLIVLLTRKPTEKSEDFGETSYY